jgi:hypothetical protein
MIEQEDLPQTVEETNDLVAFLMGEVADIKAQIAVVRSKAMAGKNVDEEWLVRAHTAIKHRQRDIIQLNAHKKNLVHKAHGDRAKEARETRLKAAATISEAYRIKNAVRKANVEAQARIAAAAAAAKAERVKAQREETMIKMGALCSWLKANHPAIWAEAIPVLKEAETNDRD